MAKTRLRRGAFATMASAHPDPAAAAIGALPAITVMILRWPANSWLSSTSENNAIDRADMATTAAEAQVARRAEKSAAQLAVGVIV